MQIKIHTYINMVKNIPTIERSTKIRFGKHVSDSQAENTIVFNASDSAVNATNTGSIYMAPLRVAELAGSNLIGYSASTKEVVDSSVPTSLLGGVTLQASTDRGNVTSNIVQFSNAITGFVTTSNIGVANSAPIHAVSVKDKVFMCGPTGDTNTLRVEGTTRSNKFTTGSSINIDESVTNKIQVSGTIHSSTYTGSNLGLANTAPAHAISIGNQGQVQMNVPTASIYALDTVGNVNAQNYRGDSYYLSNLTMENIVNQGNVTSNTVQFTNALTSIHTLSNVDVGGNVFIRESADALYGKIAGANTIAGSTITASTQFSGPGSGLTSIPTNQFATGAIPFSSGGTGQSSYASGTILYGKTSGDSLGQLNPAGSNADAGKFLRLDNNDIPEWAEVPLTLDSVLGNTTAESDGSMSLTDTGTTITTAGKIEAATFEGSGSDIRDINAANVVQVTNSTLSTTVLPTVPVTKGGTGLDTVTAGDILYANANDTIAGLDKGTGHEVLQMKSDGTLPEWTQTITGATLSGPSLTGTVTTQLGNNKIPFTNGSGQLSSHSDLQFTSSGGNSTMTIGADVTITGGFTTRGTVDHLETTNYTVTDPIIEVGNNNSTDTIDLGMIMTMNTANVVHGFRGDKKEYTIAYTHSNPSDTDIEPTLASGIPNHPYITANIWGNVLTGNVTTTGTVDAATLKGNGANITHLNLGDANNTGPVAASLGGTGVTTGLTALNAGNINTGTLAVARGGTNIGTYTAGDILFASNDSTPVLTKLPVSNGKFLKSTADSVQWADVSSTLNAIVQGGNTTTRTVTFQNTDTGLSSDGDITIAADKKLKFVDDILLEGGSGTSNLKVNNAIIVSPQMQHGNPSTMNVLSIDVSTGEIYDSGGQGGSTMEFTHEEGSGDHANVSIGKAAWAGPTGESNLTINTYGSNVLTVTGNVSATNITIGALHVAASPFNLDDVASAGASANITSNVIQFTGPPGTGGYTTDNAFVTTKSISIGSNVTTTGNIFVGVDTTVTGNVTSQNLQLTNTEIATTWTSGSGTLEIDCKNKSYGTAPLTSIDADVAILSVTNLPSGGQIVVPLLASGADRKVSKAITAGIDQIAFTNDVSIAQNGHGLLTVSKLDANIYMNAISFTAA